MDQTNEESSEQKSEKTTRNIPNLERIRFRNIRQSDNRQRTRRVVGGTWHQNIDVPIVVKSSPRKEPCRYICANQREDICRKMRNG